MKNIYLMKWLFALCFTAFISTIGIAQCNINSFTATPVNGICSQDGQVQIAIPGAATCSGGNAVTATIRVAGTTTDLDFQVLSPTGTASFSNLAPGNYEVRLTQSGTTVGPQTVTVTSSYVPFTVNFDEILGETCRATDQFYGPDGSVTASVSRPTTGTYTYEIQSLGLNSGPITAQTYTFDNLAAGNYVLTITENVVGCSAGIGSGFTIDPYTGTTLPSVPYTGPAGFEIVQNADCSGWNIGVSGTPNRFLGGAQNRERILGSNGSLTISYGGNTYNAVAGFDHGLGTGTYAHFENVPPNTAVVIEANDGCNVRTQTFTTPAINSDFLYLSQRSIYSSELCGPVNYIVTNERSNTGTYYTYQSSYPVTYNIYHEQPLGSGNWIQINTPEQFNTRPSDSGREHPNNSSFPLAYNFVNGESYRLEQVNSCRTLTRDFVFNASTPSHPLDDANLVEAHSILEGTSGFVLTKNNNYTGFDGLLKEITYTINRVDGLTSYTFPDSEPYSYGDDRQTTINFPIVLNTDYDLGAVRQRFINLPLGEYEVAITDEECNYTVVRTVNLTTPATYDPIINVVPTSCGAFNIEYALNRGNASFDIGNRTQLIDANTNAVIAQSGLSTAENLAGTFSNIPSGTYIIVYNNIRISGNYATYDVTNVPHSDRNNGNVPSDVETEEIVITPLPALTFSTTNLFCNPSDNNSGFIAIQTAGTPVGSITYSLWNGSSNPDADAPLQTYNTTDLTETSYVFQNLASGSYIIRVFTDCGFTEQTVNLINGNTVFPSPSANPPVVCESDNQTTLSIGLPTSTFDIEWFEGATSIGTGNSVTVNPTTTTTYTVNYELSGSLGCTNPLQASEDVTVTVTPNITLVSSETTTCAADGLSYTITATVSGTAPFTATGTGAPGTWVDNGDNTSTWTSDAIAAGTDYNVSISDSGVCDPLAVAGTSPICCVFEVTCPTFDTETVECYDEIPTATTLTEAEFEALGNADGLIGDIPCGVIEITASNSAAPACGGTVTRTYTVTEYEDPNNNDIRDAGEDTVLNTVDCIQTYTISAPVVTMPADGASIVACAADAVTPTTPTVIDNCGRTLTAVLTNTDADPSCEGTKAYTYTYTDCAGVDYTWTYTYTISAPVITMPADGASTVACAADAVTPTTPTVVDNCGRTLTAVLTNTDADPSCEGTKAYTYTYTDCQGNSHDWVYTYTIERADFKMPANGMSAVACPADAIAPVLPLVTDNCGNVLTPSAPVVTELPSPICEGIISYTYTYTDCAGNSHDWVHTYIVERKDFSVPANGSSTVACISEAVAPTSLPTVTDNCGNVLTPISSFIGGTYDGCSGTRTYNYQYQDCEGYNHIWTYEYTINAPVVTLPVNGSSTVSCASEALVVPVAPMVTDNCGRFLIGFLTNVSATPSCAGTKVYTYTYVDCTGTPYTWEYTYTISNPVVTMPAAGSSTVACVAEAVAPTAPTVVDNCGRALTAVLTNTDADPACSGTKAYTYTYTDCTGTPYTWTYTYTISAPMVTMPANGLSTVACPSDVVAPTVPTVTNNCGNVLTPSAAVISQEPTCEGDITYTYTFTDCEGTTHDWTHTFTIEREDFSVPANTASTVACASAITAPTVPTVTDNCGNVLPPSGPVISQEPACEGDVTYTYTFTDCEGNTHPWTHTFTIEREDFILPANGSETVSCISAAVAPVLPTVTDNCGNVLTPVFSFEGGTYDGCEGTRTFNYEYKDCANHTQTWVYTYIIEAEDFTLPANGSSTVACASEIVAPTVPTVTDNCGNVLTASAPVVSALPSCEGDVTYTYTFTDCQGNSHNWVYTYTIEDTVAPTGTAPSDLVLECMSAIPAADAAAILDEADNCNGSVTVTVSDIDNGGSGCLGNAYIITRTYTLTDCAGNQTDLVQTITVEDSTGPEFVEVLPMDITLECSDSLPAVAELTAVDNCGAATVSFNEERTEGSCPNSYTLERTWTATDACGNTTTHTQVITVEDTTAPEFVGPMPNREVFMRCEDFEPAEILTAVDNCGTASVRSYDEKIEGDCEAKYDILRTWVATDDVEMRPVIRKQFIYRVQ
ncbi:hypothetical protein [Flavobacterium sp. N2155]|uniref:HYR-like domain-containing protein n=1 Tax=Flavobacterium sp. N2155 TaxID=2986830 RepID=UPI002224D654|nr:hypothetical protein [Flavobacterium sp. N2155]